MEEILNTIWQWVLPLLGGVSVSAILSVVISGALSGAFKKTISSINVDKIAETATEKGVEKVKVMAFSQSIQPIVVSELKKVTEEANGYIKKELDEVSGKYDKLIKILESLSAYFDNSIGITDETKATLKEAIENAKSPTYTEKIEVVEQATEIATPVAKKTAIER